MSQQPLIDQSNNQNEFFGGIRTYHVKNRMKADINSHENNFTRVHHQKKDVQTKNQQSKHVIALENYNNHVNTSLEPKLQPLTQWMYHSIPDLSQEFIEWYNTKIQYKNSDPIFKYLEKYQQSQRKKLYTRSNDNSCETFKYFSCLDHQFFNENGFDKEYCDKFIKYLTIAGQENLEWYLKLYALSQMIVEQHISMGGVNVVSAVYQNQYIIYTDPELEIGKMCLVCNKCGVKIVNPIDKFVKYLENVYCGEHTGSLLISHDINCGNLCYQMVGVGIKPTSYFQTQPEIGAYTIIGLGDPAELMNLSIQVMPDYSLLAKCLKLKNNYSQTYIIGQAKPLSLDKRLIQKQNSQIQLYGGIKDKGYVLDTFKIMRNIELCRLYECLTGKKQDCDSMTYMSTEDPKTFLSKIQQVYAIIIEQIQQNEKIQQNDKKPDKEDLIQYYSRILFNCLLPLQPQIQLNVSNDAFQEDTINLTQRIIDIYNDMNKQIKTKDGQQKVKFQSSLQDNTQLKKPYFKQQCLKFISQVNLFKNYLISVEQMTFDQKQQVQYNILNNILNDLLSRNLIPNKSNNVKITITTNNQTRTYYLNQKLQCTINQQTTDCDVYIHNYRTYELNYISKIMIKIDEKYKNINKDINDLLNEIYLHTSKDRQGRIYIDRVYVLHGAFYVNIPFDIRNSEKISEKINFFPYDSVNADQQLLYQLNQINKQYVYQFHFIMESYLPERAKDHFNIGYVNFGHVRQLYVNKWLHEEPRQSKDQQLNIDLPYLEQTYKLNHYDDIEKGIIKAYISTMELIYQIIIKLVTNFQNIDSQLKYTIKSIISMIVLSQDIDQVIKITDDKLHLRYYTIGDKIHILISAHFYKILNMKLQQIATIFANKFNDTIWDETWNNILNSIRILLYNVYYKKMDTLQKFQLTCENYYSKQQKPEQKNWQENIAELIKRLIELLNILNSK